MVSPVLAAIAVAVKLEDGGPVFYRQIRVGRAGIRFKIWKFRTMVRDADRDGPPLTVGADSRITRTGAWLRKLKLDELPQLLNVLAGEMSLVGPRPEVPEFVAHYDSQQRVVLDYVPGITDPASIAYVDENDLLAAAKDPRETYLRDVMPRKIAINLEYASDATVVSDALVILRTVLKVATRQKGPDSPKVPQG